MGLRKGYKYKEKKKVCVVCKQDFITGSGKKFCCSTKCGRELYKDKQNENSRRFYLNHPEKLKTGRLSTLKNKYNLWRRQARRDFGQAQTMRQSQPHHEPQLRRQY